MSYQRRAKKGIPKNTIDCTGCKHRIKKYYTKEEMRDRELLSDDFYYVCNYLKLESDKFTENKYYELRYLYKDEEEFKKVFKEWEQKELLHYAEKVCGLYEPKPIRTPEWIHRWERIRYYDYPYFTPNDNYIREVPF